MLDTHRGMNVDEAECMAVIDNLLDALEQEQKWPGELADGLFARCSMRRDITLA